MEAEVPAPQRRLPRGRWWPPTQDGSARTPAAACLQMCWWTGCQRAEPSRAGLLGESWAEGLKSLHFRRLVKVEGPWAREQWVLAPREGVHAGFGTVLWCLWLSVVAKVYDPRCRGLEDLPSTKACIFLKTP